VRIINASMVKLGEKIILVQPHTERRRINLIHNGIAKSQPANALVLAVLRKNNKPLFGKAENSTMDQALHIVCELYVSSSPYFDKLRVTFTRSLISRVEDEIRE